MGSKRAYLIRGCVAMLNHNIKMSGNLIVSAEVLGKSDEPYGRMFTLGKTFWWKHYSPMIGRLTGMTAPDDEEKKDGKDKNSETNEKNEKKDQGKAQKYEWAALNRSNL